MVLHLPNEQPRVPPPFIKQYYSLLRETGVLPNFWVSPTYWAMSEMEKIESPCRSAVSLGWKEIAAFPPISLVSHKILQETVGKNGPEVMYSFPEVRPTDKDREVFVGFNYIYDPQEFIGLKGKRWSTLRTSISKWTRSNPNCVFYAGGCPNWDSKPSCLFLKEWQQNNSVSVSDFDIMIRYFVSIENVPNCGFLFQDQMQTELIGLVTWDWNWQFVNLRFCLHKDEPYLAEFLRWRFYVYIAGLQQHRLVNSGGDRICKPKKNINMNTNVKATLPIYSWKEE